MALELNPEIVPTQTPSNLDKQNKLPMLTYIRYEQIKEIDFSGRNLPNLSLNNIPCETIHLKIQLISNNRLEIKPLDPINNNSKSIFIDEKDDTRCFQEFNYFFNNESIWRSEDFKNLKTQRLYQFLKQAVALWAKGNSLVLYENGSPVPILKKQSILQRWSSRQAWSYWLEDKKAWWQNNTRNIFAGTALGVATIGGLWYAAKKQTGSMPNVPQAKVITQQAMPQ